jgi:hypothetical protein
MSKYLKYLRYLLRHKWYVMIECFKYGLIWRGLVHDLSKFLPSEFFSYANYFYGSFPPLKCFHGDNRNWALETGLYEEKITEEFNYAWNLHQKRNKHHWQYWVCIQDSDKPKIFSVGMPRKYLIEMLCDWRGAGRAINGKDDTAEWYKKNKKNMILRESNFNWIEKELKILKNE